MMYNKVWRYNLHNHFVPGGSRSYIRDTTGIDILPVDRPISSMKEMDDIRQNGLKEI